MKIIPTQLSGAFVIESERSTDERGWFARSFCKQTFAQHRLPNEFVQHNLSFNEHAGTVRGMHFSTLEAAETKLVRCVQGKIYDVLVDMRRDSPSYLQQQAFELSGADSDRALLIPPGCAHGFQTLQANSLVLYLMSSEYQPTAARGVNYFDKAINIRWPAPVKIIAEKDRNWAEWQ